MVGTMDVTAKLPESLTPSEVDAYNRGISSGWDAANFRGAYGDGEETFPQECARRADSYFAQSRERNAFRLGFELGGIRFDHDQWSDGSTDDRTDEPKRTDQL